MKVVFLHPISLRIWHWINAVLIFFLIITGIQLRFPVVTLFPYDHAVSLHKIAGFISIGPFLYWLAYYIITGGFSKHYRFRMRDVKGMTGQAFYYAFSMFKGAKNPFTPSAHERFNVLQKIAYLSVMLILTPLIIITGILFSDIIYFLNVINYIGGVRIMDALHVAAAYAFLLFLIVHPYMATLGYRVISHIKAMITGYSEEEDE
jgi:thiosulfate reductase cytochrome b subunit